MDVMFTSDAEFEGLTTVTLKYEKSLDGNTTSSTASVVTFCGMFQKLPITHMYDKRAPTIREASMSRTMNRFEIAMFDFLGCKFFPRFCSIGVNHLHSGR
jgi:hypothetical protein